MCGIIGLRCNDGEISKLIMESLLVNSQIRGKHSTGLAYFKGKKIQSQTLPIPAEKFIKAAKIPESQYMIGHVRYSTSNLLFNQPLVGELIGLVHNGIMSQEEPESWTQHGSWYENFKTKNDSELLLKCLENKRQPFIDFPHCSVAAGILENNVMRCFRNMTRPLWIFESTLCFDGVPVFSGFASTKDIIERTFSEFGDYFEVKITETKPFVKYTFLPDGNITQFPMKSKPTLFSEDQQKSTEIERKYV